MLSLVEQLQAQGLDIRYDQIVLNIGDSLIEKISAEIADGDFVIAVVSPDWSPRRGAKESYPWLRQTRINQQRVKVLPVKFREAEMPLMLRDAFWADGDRDNVETIAQSSPPRCGLTSVAATRTLCETPSKPRRLRANQPTPKQRETWGSCRSRTWPSEPGMSFRHGPGIWDGGNVRDLDDPQRGCAGRLMRSPTASSRRCP